MNGCRGGACMYVWQVWSGRHAVELMLSPLLLSCCPALAAAAAAEGGDPRAGRSVLPAGGCTR